MRTFRIILSLAFFAVFVSIAAAQNSTAREEFESYERSLPQASKAVSDSVKAGISAKIPAVQQNKPAASSTVKKSAPSQLKNKPETNSAPPSSGLPGMKIWIEKQAGCAGAFSLVAPTMIFNTGDCVRVRFRLNFDGHLTIVNYGSSGAIDKIFPLENQSGKIDPKTDNFIPDNRGWEFFDVKGDENLFFVVSKMPLKIDAAREIANYRNVETESVKETEVYDRDLRPRTEKNEIFVLAEESRFEKPLVFRLTLKHR